MRAYSVRNNIPLKHVEAVISHQFESANQALKTTKSIELSGFAKFIFNEKKLYKVIEKNISKEKTFKRIIEETKDEKKRKSAMVKLENTQKFLREINEKIHGFESNSRGMEEQIDTPSRIEGDNKESIEGEKGDL
jgi:hypothetical protein